MVKETQATLLKPVETIKGVRSLSSKLKERRSKEIVLAFCGPVGSNIPQIVDKVEEILKTRYRYEVVRIKISKLIKQHARKVDSSFDERELNDPAQRYLKLQDLGNNLRKKYGREILSNLPLNL